MQFSFTWLRLKMFQMHPDKKSSVFDKIVIQFDGKNIKYELQKLMVILDQTI